MSAPQYVHGTLRARPRCPACAGSGYAALAPPYPDDDGDELVEDCLICEGTGRDMRAPQEWAPQWGIIEEHEPC